MNSILICWNGMKSQTGIAAGNNNQINGTKIYMYGIYIYNISWVSWLVNIYEIKACKWRVIEKKQKIEVKTTTEKALMFWIKNYLAIAKCICCVCTRRKDSFLCSSVSPPKKGPKVGLKICISESQPYFALWWSGSKISRQTEDLINIVQNIVHEIGIITQ